MKTTVLTAAAVLLATTSMAFANGAYSNDSFVGQVGYFNAAVVYQANGNNNQGTLQFGGGNVALTGQVADPTRGNENNSLTAQLGWNNIAATGQSGSAGENTSLTIQSGVGNGALTLQKSAAGLDNNSATVQFGVHNIAFTLQH